MKVKVISSSEDHATIWYGGDWATRYVYAGEEVEKDDDLIETYYRNGTLEFEETEIDEINTAPEIQEEIQYDVENRQAKLEEYEI